MDICYRCNKECVELYKVKIITERGIMSFENVCSVECGDEIREELYCLHLSRANQINNQIFQRLK